MYEKFDSSIDEMSMEDEANKEIDEIEQMRKEL